LNSICTIIAYHEHRSCRSYLGRYITHNTTITTSIHNQLSVGYSHQLASFSSSLYIFAAGQYCNCYTITSRSAFIATVNMMMSPWWSLQLNSLWYIQVLRKALCNVWRRKSIMCSVISYSNWVSLKIHYHHLIYGCDVLWTVLATSLLPWWLLNYDFLQFYCEASISWKNDNMYMYRLPINSWKLALLATFLQYRYQW